jgi:uncharacterized protein YcfJ
MSIPRDLKEKLLKLKNERIPPEKREKFAKAIKERLSDINYTKVGGYTVAGAIIGGAIDAIPGTGWITDDWVEIGAALGGWVGLAKDNQERKMREKIRTHIMESFNEAMA